MSFLLALGLGIVLIPAARRVGIAFGLVDRPSEEETGSGELKIHDRPVPVLGGLAVVAAALGAGAILGSQPSPWLYAAVLGALAVGLLDDLRPLSPWVRIVALLLAGGALALGGWRVSPLGPLSVAAVVLLAPGCANAVNLMDGQDGLAGGLATLAALGLAGTMALTADGPADTAAGLALAGALVAFLAWNRPPASIFLGNGGAYAVGVMLAALAASASAAGGWTGLLAAGASLLPFGFELAFTAARRLRWRAPLTRGDRGHSYDLLSAALGSRLRSTIVCWGVGAGSAALALGIALLPLAAGIGLAGVVAMASLAAGAWLLTRTVDRTKST